MSIGSDFVVSSEAGQGVQSVGFLLPKVFARGAYHIFTDLDYESRIRGGRNFFRVRDRDGRIGAITKPVDFPVALNRENIDLHRKELAAGRAAIFDGEA